MSGRLRLVVLTAAVAAAVLVGFSAQSTAVDPPQATLPPLPNAPCVFDVTAATFPPEAPRDVYIRVGFGGQRSCVVVAHERPSVTQFEFDRWRFSSEGPGTIAYGPTRDYFEMTLAEYGWKVLCEAEISPDALQTVAALPSPRGRNSWYVEVWSRVDSATASALCSSLIPD